MGRDDPNEGLTVPNEGETGTAPVRGRRLGSGYNAGWFLASEKCTRVTRMVGVSYTSAGANPNMVSYVVSNRNGRQVLPAGTLIYDSSDPNFYGFLYQDTDITDGDTYASVVTGGRVYNERLPFPLPEENWATIAQFGIFMSHDPDRWPPETDGEGEGEGEGEGGGGNEVPTQQEI